MSSTPRVPSAVEGADATFATALAHQPELAASFFRLYGTMWSHGVVDHVTKETIRLRNARVTDCGFCRQVRFDRARDEGLTEAVADLIDDGYEASDLSARQKAVLRLTDVYLRDPHDVTPDVTDAVSAELTPEEVVESTFALSLFMGFAKVLIALGVEPPPGTMPTTVLPTPDHVGAAA
jgi:AhpD family alkylhydroperoxidase